MTKLTNPFNPRANVHRPPMQTNVYTKTSGDSEVKEIKTDDTDDEPIQRRQLFSAKKVAATYDRYNSEMSSNPGYTYIHALPGAVSKE